MYSLNQGVPKKALLICFPYDYRVSRKKVYPFAANLVNIKYKDIAHLNYANR